MERDQYVDFCAQQMDHVFGERLRDMGIAATDNGNRLSWREERMVDALLYAVANEMDRQRKQAAESAATVPKTKPKQLGDGDALDWD